MLNRNKRICFFNSAIAWGGGEKWHFDMANAMNKSEFEVFFFVHPDSELMKRLNSSEIKIIPFKVTNLSFLNPFSVNKLKKLLQENSIDVIIINLSRDLKLAGLAAKRAKLSRIIYRRGSAIPIRNSFLNRYIFKNIITNIIANTIATKETILQNNQDIFNKGKIKVIYNGIDLDKLYAQEYSSYYKKEENEILIGNLGRLENQKAQHYLLDLALELKKRACNFKILIAGKGRLEQMLKERCTELNLCDKVIFTGFNDNIKSFYSDIDIFVLTSKWEGFGYVIAEAMAFKKPVVAFNISSNPEIIDDHVTGYLVDFPDIKLMTEKVEKLIKDESLRRIMGEKGNERVRDLFVLENKIVEFKEFINSII